MRIRPINDKRVCVECHSDETKIQYHARYCCESWFRAEKYGKSGWLCRTCWTRLRRRIFGRPKPNNTPERLEARRRYLREYVRETRTYHYYKFLQYRLARNVRIKTKLMQILGQNCCQTCGFAIFQALVFDHINNGGRTDHVRFRDTKTLQMYYIKHPDAARKKLQVLCANCNTIKQHRVYQVGQRKPQLYIQSRIISEA